MTDRVRRLTVHLDRDYRDDDIEQLVCAIEQLKGVAGVEQQVVDVMEHVARETIRLEIKMQLYEAVDKILSNK